MECCFSSICPNDLIASEFVPMNAKRDHRHNHPSDHHQLNSSTCSSSSSSSCSDLDLMSAVGATMPENEAGGYESAAAFDPLSAAEACFYQQSAASLIDVSNGLLTTQIDVKPTVITTSNPNPTHLYQIQNINFKPVMIVDE